MKINHATVPWFRILAFLAILAGIAAAVGYGNASASTSIDQRVARAPLLRVGDFPAGWRLTGTLGTGFRGFDCPTVRQAHQGLSAEASSRDFEAPRADGTSANTFTLVYRSVAGARRGFGRLASRSTRVCFGEALARVVDAQETTNCSFGSVTTTQLLTASFGDQRAASRMRVPLMCSNGARGALTEDFRFVRVDRAVAILVFFTGPGSQIASPLHTRLTGLAAKRLRSALAAGGLPPAPMAFTRRAQAGPSSESPHVTGIAKADNLHRVGRIQFRVADSRPQRVEVNWSVLCFSDTAATVDRDGVRRLRAPGMFTPPLPARTYRSNDCLLQAFAVHDSVLIGGRLTVSIWVRDRPAAR